MPAQSLPAARTGPEVTAPSVNAANKDAEPNDTPGQATQIFDVGDIGFEGTFRAIIESNGTVHGGDDDWYRITIENPGKLTLLLTPPVGGGTWASEGSMLFQLTESISR